MTNDPTLQLAAIVAAVAAGVMAILWIITRRTRNPGECTDFTHAFDRPPEEGRAPSRPRVPAPPLEPEVDELPPLEPEFEPPLEPELDPELEALLEPELLLLTVVVFKA